MAKHLSKEELQTDPLLENVAKATTFFNENKTIILSIIIGITVVVGSLIGYRYYSTELEQQAQELLSIAESYYSEGDYDRALNGDSFELTYGFLAIANDFSGTEAGNLANYYASVSSFKMGDIENALSYFENYDAPSGILGVGSISFYASILKENGSLEKAAKTFLDAAAWNENESTSPYNLFQAAKTYYELGNLDTAQELATQILQKYPNSPEATESMKLEGMISATM